MDTGILKTPQVIVMGSKIGELLIRNNPEVLSLGPSPTWCTMGALLCLKKSISSLEVSLEQGPLIWLYIRIWEDLRNSYFIIFKFISLLFLR